MAELMISAGVFPPPPQLLIVMLTIEVNDSPRVAARFDGGGGGGEGGRTHFPKAYMVFIHKPVCSMASGLPL